MWVHSREQADLQSVALYSGIGVGNTKMGSVQVLQPAWRRARRDTVRLTQIGELVLRHPWETSNHGKRIALEEKTPRLLMYEPNSRSGEEDAIPRTSQPIWLAALTDILRHGK